ncbi:MAG: quaternary ammonium transporter, partial [Cyanobacteria bacterium SW_9_47_5]
MLPVRRFLSLLLVTALTSVTVIACNLSSSSSDTAIQIGSKDFTEQLILGQMYALALEDKGYSVERKLNLGGTPVAQAGLEEGEI